VTLFFSNVNDFSESFVWKNLEKSAPNFKPVIVNMITVATLDKTSAPKGIITPEHIRATPIPAAKRSPKALIKRAFLGFLRAMASNRFNSWIFNKLSFRREVGFPFSNFIP
jgi:hypothetical protein